MGTRFMMSSDSPTPRSTLERYLATKDTQQIRVTLAVDGMRHRMVDNPFINKLESAGPMGRLWIALNSARKWKAQSGMTTGQMIRAFCSAIKDDAGASSRETKKSNPRI